MAAPRQELRKEAILNRARPDDLRKKRIFKRGIHRHPLLGRKRIMITVQSYAAIKPYVNCQPSSVCVDNSRDTT